MKQLFIDLTTKNCLFNPVEPQGSFLFHRFGKRNITEEHIDITSLIAYLDIEKPDQIVLECVFGDPLEYQYLPELLEYCQLNNIQSIFVCNGYSDNFHILQDYYVYVICNLYGFTDTFNIILPDCDFNVILNNLKYYDKIQYYVYKENLSDIDNVIDTNIEVEFLPAILVHDNINHVTTQDGKWLYDVHGLAEFKIEDINHYNSLKQITVTDTEPQQTMEGYQLLKNYVSDAEGQSILSTDIYNMENTNTFEQHTAVCYKGFIFKSIEERNIITNCYINDWSLKQFNTNDTYHKSIVSVLSDFANNKRLSI